MKNKKSIDITPSICVVSSHQYQLAGPEEGMAKINGQRYHWWGGCPLCVDDKLKEIEKANGEVDIYYAKKIS